MRRAGEDRRSKAAQGIIFKVRQVVSVCAKGFVLVMLSSHCLIVWLVILGSEIGWKADGDYRLRGVPWSDIENQGLVVFR